MRFSVIFILLSSVFINKCKGQQFKYDSYQLQKRNDNLFPYTLGNYNLGDRNLNFPWFSPASDYGLPANVFRLGQDFSVKPPIFIPSIIYDKSEKPITIERQKLTALNDGTLKNILSSGDKYAAYRLFQSNYVRYIPESFRDVKTDKNTTSVLDKKEEGKNKIAPRIGTNVIQSLAGGGMG